MIVLELEALKDWTSARWWFAAVMAIVSALAIGLPTDVIPNPVFGRQGTPVEPWAMPVLAITAVLSGLLFATYVRTGEPVETDAARPPQSVRQSRRAAVVLRHRLPDLQQDRRDRARHVRRGSTWSAPIQPYLGVVALGLLAWALRVRLRGEVACTVEAGRDISPIAGWVAHFAQPRLAACTAQSGAAASPCLPVGDAANVC